MPTDAVYIVVTVPKKDHERELIQQKRNSRKIRYEGIDPIQDEPLLEDVLEEALQTLGIMEVSWVSSKNDKYYQAYFCTDLYENDATLTYLQSKGIGVRSHSSVGYIPFGLFFCNEGFEDLDELVDDSGGVLMRHSVPNSETGNKLEIGKKMEGFKKIRDDFLKSVTSRLTVAQVVQGVRSSSEMTFDFVMYAIFAGCIAAAGLLNNSAVDVAAAMMIEPVMATVIAITFGLVIHDRELTWIGVRSCFISLIICLIVGYVYGGIAFIWWKEWDPPPAGYWPTPEMQVRGLWRTLWYGALQAFAAGGAVAVTLLNDNQAALVGVAVASTFLPPFINTGLLWAYATHIQVRGHHQTELRAYNDTFTGTIVRLPPAWLPMEGYTPVYYTDMRWEFMALSGVSMIYTFVNVFCMIAFGCLLLKVKEVVPLGNLEPHHRFFKEDIKVARDYNRRATQAAISGIGPTAEDTIGTQILSEWADIAGLDSKTLLSDKPEARVTQLQTLQDILDDVGADDTYISVTRSAVGKPCDNQLRRRTLASVFGVEAMEAAGGRRKSRIGRKDSVRPPGTGAPTVSYDVESNLSKGQRRYQVASKSPRRGSKWLPSFGDAPIPSPNLTVGSEGSVNQAIGTRGLRPTEAASAGNRRASVLLQQTLKEADHSPFSMWPSGGRRPSEVAARADLRRRSITNTALARRISRLPRLSTFSESNA